MSLQIVKRKLARHAGKEKAKVLQSFFKTGPGEYAEGDVFIGVAVPRIRSVAQEHSDLCLADSIALLQSAVHEERLLSLFILILQYQSGGDRTKRKIYDTYLEHTNAINNWDLVDLSSHHIVGAFLADKDKKPLYALARSGNIWERRIAIVSTYHYIKSNNFEHTLKIAKALLADTEDLIHKATGWMLREIGKRNCSVEEAFLKRYYTRMPRTMLRYAIERFPEAKRQRYLRGKIECVSL